VNTRGLIHGQWIIDHSIFLYLVGGLEHVLFFHILRIIIPFD
jgi:hypothetical protein